MAPPGRPSLWALLEARVPPAERRAVRRLLGDEAVERSLELHDEVAALRELLRRERRVAGRPGALLAAPPPLRELLRTQIRLLLLGLRRRAAREGRDGEGAVAGYSPGVVTFAMAEPAGARPGALRPESPAARPPAALAQRLDSLSEALNVARLPHVLPQLRSLLAEECRDLELQVAHLQRCLEEEHGAAAGPRAPEPTLAELQEQRRAMERDLLRGPCSASPCAEGQSPERPPCPPGAAAGPGAPRPWTPGAPAPRGPAEPPGPGARGPPAKRVPRQDLTVPPPWNSPWPPSCPGALGDGPHFLPCPPSVLPPPRSALGRHRRLLPCQGLC